MPAPPPLTLGARLRGRRAEVGMSRKDLGRRAGVSPKAIGRFERGDPPDVVELRKLAEALTTSFEDLASLPVAP